MPPYRHVQSGYLIAALIAAAVAGVLLAAGGGSVRSVWIVLGVLLGTAVFFSRLTVEVAGGSLRVAFGPGWPYRQWPLGEIASVRRVRNPWYAGWGIHWVPGRPGYWLLNVSGLNAVEIQLRSGRRYRIGTDDPEGLLAALRQAGVPAVP